MPTYEYVCEKCGHEFEFSQSMKDKALATCPKEECAQKRWGKGHVKRRIGAGAGLIFKGSGFYITDNRSENYKAGAKKEAGATTPAVATPAKSEGKSAATSGSGAAASPAAAPAPAPAAQTKSTTKKEA